MSRPAQLELRNPVPLREAMARECGRILESAAREAETLRALGLKPDLPRHWRITEDEARRALAVVVHVKPTHGAAPQAEASP